MTTPVIATPVGPFHADPGRIPTWSEYDLINYPTSASKSQLYDIVFDQRKRDAWAQRMKLDPSNPLSLQITDPTARVTPPILSTYGAEDKFDSKPANIWLDSFLAAIVATWLVYVIIKGKK